MRAPVGRIVRVWPGDQLVVRARLPAEVSLARLFVFARASEDSDFSPYVPQFETIGDRPTMLSLMSLRLTTQNPARTSVFDVDIRGCVRIMQEVDTARDVLAVVKIRRIAAPSTSPLMRVVRKMVELVSWPSLKRSS